MKPDEYLEQRVENQIEYYEHAASREKQRHIWIQSVVIVFGVTVPVLVNLPDWSLGWFDLSVFARISATLLSLSVSILAGLANFRKFEDLWLAYRMTEELLKKEKYLYLTSSGDYSKVETAFPLFVDRIEQLISVEHSKFQAFIREARRPTKPAAKKGQDGEPR